MGGGGDDVSYVNSKSLWSNVEYKLNVRGPS